MSTLHNGSDYERLKEELRRLKRRGAPWYFESALHQRLHGGRRRRPRLRPIPIFPVLAVAFFTLCILALAVYVVLMHTNLITPGSHPGGPVPADTLSRVRSVDSLLSGPPGGSARVKGTPGTGARTLLPARPSADTSRRRLPDFHTVTRDSAAAPVDTAVPRRDSSSHVPDTTFSHGADGHSG